MAVLIYAMKFGHLLFRVSSSIRVSWFLIAGKS